MLEITLVGYVGSIRFANAGETQVLNVSVASSRRFGDKEYTDWISAKIWGERAVKLKDHIQKGARLLVRGRPEAKAFQRGDGSVTGELVVHVNDLEFLSAKIKEPDDQLPLDANEGKSKRKKTA